MTVCAVAGAAGGLCLALAWDAEIPRRLQGGTAGRLELWDAWLDESHDAAIGATQSAEYGDEHDGDDDGQRARVRPRVYSSEGGTLPLEDVIGPILASHDRGAVRVSGPDGSGKTTALKYLAGLVPPHMEVLFMDCPDPLALSAAAARGLVVFASIGVGPKLLAELKLAPWGRDEWIEYLLAGGDGSCASVMARVARREEESDLLDGIPELWSIALGLMAADRSVDGPREALRVALDRRLTDRDYRTLIEHDCLAALVMRAKSPSRHIGCLRRHGPDDSVSRLIRHRAVQLLLAADRIGEDLVGGAECPALADPLPRDLVREVALRIPGRPEAVEHLVRLLAGPNEALHPMAASLLHAMRLGWRPGRPAPCLKGAFLEGASWSAAVLSDADMRDVDLSRSNLWGAHLERARLGDACLTSADLRSASLCGAQFGGADLSRARLAGARAENASFASARLDGADLEGAVLDRAILRGADLRGSRLIATSLIGADLSSSQLEGADFSRANLSGAVMTGLKLSVARFDGARFPGADLSRGDLEDLVLPGADFSGANLGKALLTGSRMPGANFRGAGLRAAGLAAIEWERADLRGADLREVAFHLGSSRSGLVGSPLACEGSRTGFYTDDYNEQDFKGPEEIRKANLVGADLRGANIEGVDFYLVDLREARLDPEQIPHLRHCGAILESRV